MATYQKRGNRWRAQVRRKGFPPLSQSFPSKSEARKWAEQIEGKLAVGERVSAQTEQADISLAKALKLYLAEVTPTKKGFKQEEERIKTWLKDPLAKRSLSSIQPMDIAEWRNKRTKKGKAPTTIKNALTIISQVYVIAAKEWGMQVANPVRGLRMPKSRPPRDRRLLPGEEERIAKACSCSWLRAAFILSLETAMRRGELLSLKRSDIQGRTALLRMTKNGKARAVPLSIRAKTTIDSLPVSLVHRRVQKIHLRVTGPDAATRRGLDCRLARGHDGVNQAIASVH